MVFGFKCMMFLVSGYVGFIFFGYFIYFDIGRVLFEVGNLGYDL